MRFRPGLRCVAAIAATAVAISSESLPAQVKPAPPKPDPTVKSPGVDKQGPRQLAWVDLRRYDVGASRAAFAVCDDNGDDRLDVLETRRCLPGISGDREREAFQRIDTNRDGFIHWPEFDARFRQRTEARVSFRFRPSRPFTNPAPQLAARQQRSQRTLDFVMEMANADDDPHLSKDEFIGLLRALKQPPAAASFFAALDADRSGSLSKAELRPVVARIPYLTELARQAATKAAPAPTKGEAVAPEELQKRLDRIHPLLGRWGARVFKSADADGDGKLSGAELTTKG